MELTAMNNSKSSADSEKADIAEPKKSSSAVHPESALCGKAESEGGSDEPRTCAQAVSSPTAFIGWGFLFSLVYCVIVGVASAARYPQANTLCAFPPINEPNNSAGLAPDYPNPRCPDYTRFGNDTGPYWYYWRAIDYVWYSQATAWIFYVLHQMSSWYIIFAAQMKFSSDKMPLAEGQTETTTLPRDEKYSNRMRPHNWWGLGVNGFFVVLHLLQTHFMGYDALAPSVHEMASQGSVILLLVIVMMMETDRRGMWFGQPQSLFNEAIDVAKRYHGYIFSWAVIFTFWYHPMEGYLGHLFGIMHVLIIMVQGALIFTDAHLNRLWRMVLEAWVFLHASVISTQTLGSNSWPMFLFGFGAIFVISQLPGLPSLQRCHVVVRVIPAVVLAALYVTAFVLVENWTSFPVFAFIPAAIYLGAIGLNLVLMVFLVAGRACCTATCSSAASTRPKSTKASTGGFIALFLVIVGIVIAFSIISEVVVDRHSFEATLMVYGSMVVGVAFLFPVMQCALPRPTGEARRQGCTTCCCWDPPECCSKSFPCCYGDSPPEEEAGGETQEANSEEEAESKAGGEPAKLSVASGDSASSSAVDVAVAKAE